MLTVCSTIIENAIAHQEALIAKRPGWADPYFPDNKTRIDNAFLQYLGVDNAAALRNATQTVNSLMAQALDSLSEFNVQVKSDFSNNPAQLSNMLTSLGFAQHYKGAYKKNQQELIELLFKFSANMTPALKAAIVAKGTSPALIDSIVSFAETLKNANVTQESMKGARKEISQQGVTEFNEIYNTVIGIAKISASIFKKSPAISSQFSFSKLLKALKGSSASGNGQSSGISAVTVNQPGDNEISPVNL